MWVIIVDENMHNAEARVHIDCDEIYPLGGWERIWGSYDTKEEAMAALPEAKEWVAGFMLPG